MHKATSHPHFFLRDLRLPRVLRVFLALVFLAAQAAYAQPARTPGAGAELLAEINRDIWTPFAKAYEAGDVEGYLKLHRPDFVRGESGRKRVSNLEEYSHDMRAFFAPQKERGARSFHGKFHTVARKEDSVWRLLVDYDSNEGNTIDEAVFKAATAQDEFEPFVK